MIGRLAFIPLAFGCGGSGLLVDDVVEHGALGLCINELMPKNQSSISDENGQYSDWIELHAPGDDPVDLAGWSLSDDPADPRLHIMDDLTVPAGGFVVLWADERAGLEAHHLGFSLDADGGELGLFDPTGSGSVVGYGTVHADFSVARATDCCTGDGCLGFDFRGTPGFTNEPTTWEDVPLVETGSVWRYHTGAEHAGWAEPGFDDSDWASGRAPLGYGDAHQVTVIDYGPNASAKYPTSWFRHAFDVDDGVDGVRIGLLRDDGAAVYLDGEEVVRDNLPAGALDADVLALQAVGGTDETAVRQFEIRPFALGPGRHHLAVEVHQAAPDSSDLGFDLSVVGIRQVRE